VLSVSFRLSDDESDEESQLTSGDSWTSSISTLFGAPVNITAKSSENPGNGVLKIPEFWYLQNTRISGNSEFRICTLLYIAIFCNFATCISEHVRDVICKCGQSVYAIKVLHSHGMCVDTLKDIYRAVVLAKLLYPLQPGRVSPPHPKNDDSKHSRWVVSIWWIYITTHPWPTRPQ